MRELIDILELTGHKKKNRMNEWIKEYPNDSPKGYFESYYVFFKDKKGIFFCPDGDLSEIKSINSETDLLETNPYLKADWRNFKLNFLLAENIN